MTCKDCIHFEVCYRKECVPNEKYAEKCGDFLIDCEGEVRSPIGHKYEIIRMLRKDTECPYSACAKAYEKALNYLRDGGEMNE